MNHRRRLVGLSVSTLVLAMLLAGCSGGDSESDSDTESNTEPTAGGGTAQTGSGGDSQTTGGGGTTAQAAAGGTAQTTAAGGTTAQAAAGGTTQTTAAGGTTALAAAGGTAQTTGAGGTTAQTATGGTTQTTAAGGTTAQTGAAGASQTTGTGGSAEPPPEASCTTNVTPCGGDVVGTWNVTSSCLEVSGEVDMAGFGLGCTSGTTTGSLQVTGTWTANADGTFTDNTTTSGTEQLALPGSCLAVSGTCTTCGRITGSLASTLGYASVTCEEAAAGAGGDSGCGPGCTCQATVDQAGGIGLVSIFASESGNYTAADNQIAAASGELQYAYCVSANAMTMTPQSASPKVTTGTVVFQMQ